MDAVSSWTVGTAAGAVAGTFAYTPASGTVLSAGASQTLSVSFTPSDTADYGTATGTATINVDKATPTISWATPAAITYGTALSGTQLDAVSSWTVGTAAGAVAGTFAYTPASGTVLSAGASQTLSVSFTPSDTADYGTATGTTTINVDKAAPTISWSAPSDITYGTALSGTQLDATSSWTVGTAAGAVAGTFAYTPASGTVLSAGASQTLSVSFTPSDTADYGTATQTATINVDKATPTISWSAPSDITYGTALSGTQLDAASSWTVGTAAGAVAGTFAYTPASGTVLSAGASQTLSVSFTPSDTADYGTATGTTTINVDKATPTISWSTPAAITYGTALSGTQLDATSSWTVGTAAGAVAGTFDYTPASGTVLSAGASQTLSVSFTPSDTADYGTATRDDDDQRGQGHADDQLVDPGGDHLRDGPERHAVGRRVFLDGGHGLRAVAGTFSYTPASGTVLSAGASQTLSVSFTPSDTADYGTATGTTTIDVDKATPTISWATPAAITYGTALSGTQLDAASSWTVGTAAGAVAGTFAYTPASGTVLSAGASQTLSVSFTPSDTADYGTASGTTTINVDKATPTVSWATPAAITYGTALSGTQLDAASSWTVGTTAGAVAGTFAYTPASGTVLSAGASQTLSVSFTPSDTADYGTATGTTTINVDRVTLTVTGITAANKTYNGNTTGALQGLATASLVGVLSGDTVTLGTSAAVGTFACKDVGQNITVSVTGLTIGGAEAGDYTLTQPATTANITAATLTVTGITPADKTYDGGTTATLQGLATASLVGVFSGRHGDTGDQRGGGHVCLEERGPEHRGVGDGSDHRRRAGERLHAGAAQHDGEHHRQGDHRDRGQRHQGLRRHDFGDDHADDHLRQPGHGRRGGLYGDLRHHERGHGQDAHGGRLGQRRQRRRQLRGELGDQHHRGDHGPNHPVRQSQQRGCRQLHRRTRDLGPDSRPRR